MVRILFVLWVFARLAAAFSWADSIIVEDPDVTFLTELPSGDVHLKSYRATPDVIALYGENSEIESPDLKDDPRAPDCTRAEMDALKKWTSNDIYQEINTVLRTVQKGMVKGSLVEPKMENFILVLSSAANCAPQFEGEVVRTEKTPEAVLEEYQEGNYVLMRAFTSTTKGTVPAISIPPAGCSKIRYERVVGADIDSLGISHWPSEKEVLVRPGTVFQVLKREVLPPDPHGFRFAFDFLFFD